MRTIKELIFWLAIYGAIALIVFGTETLWGWSDQVSKFTGFRMAIFFIILFVYLVIKLLLFRREYEDLNDDKKLLDRQILSWIDSDNKKHSMIHTLEFYVYSLVKGLDDIDTTSDIYKSMYKDRCNHVDELIKVKDKIPQELIEKLFDRYYEQGEDILTPHFLEEVKDIDKKFDKMKDEYKSSPNKIDSRAFKFKPGETVGVNYNGTFVTGKITSIAAKPVKGYMVYKVKGTNGKEFKAEDLEKVPY